MLGLPRSLRHRALCGALLATTLAACSGGNFLLDVPGETDAGMSPSTVADAGGNSGGGNDGNGNGNGGIDAGGTGVDAGGTGIDAGGTGIDAATDAGPSVHALAGSYAVRTVIYARQKADAFGVPLDLVSEGTLLSLVDISDSGEATEHYCFIETTNSDGITSWTLPEATERIPDSVSQLVADGDSFTRAAAADRTYVSWSPLSQPADCVQGETHSTGCLCGDPSTLPVDPNDCRALDLDEDSVKGGALYVGLRATDPVAGVDGALVKLNIVGEKAIAWRLPGTAGDKFVGEIVGGLEQSELSREGDESILSQFGRIRNSVCPGEYSHAEFVRGTFTCASIMAGRVDGDLDSYGIFDPGLDSNLGQAVDGGLSDDAATERCPDPDACKEGVTKDECGVCGGDGSSCGPCATDTDEDGTVDCQDACPNNPGKITTGACGCDAADTDTDGDGTPDCNDQCATNAPKTAPGVCGCATADTDTDSDGTPNCNDECPDNAPKTAPGTCGCATADTDSDGDGTLNCNDECPNNAPKTAPGTCGCATADTDSDADGLANCNDACPDDAAKTTVGLCGCGVADTNTDNDSQPDCTDACDNDPAKTALGVCGCGVADTDGDGDGTPNCNDGCPANAGKVAPGVCGCAVADTDSDNDGTPNCNDGCPNNAGKVAPGTCGCAVADTDTDGDGTPNCNDQCPNNAPKTAPGTCGCAVADTDTDGDGTPNCNDQCPNNAPKTAPGTCGCAVADTDTDGDGTPNCNDQCPSDPGKLVPGICNCGLADVDRNGDNTVTTADCTDLCPTDPNKFVPGICGCNIADTDSDGDGTANCNDGCPNNAPKTAPGTCGCATADTDSDGDGTPNCNDGCPNNAPKTAAGACGCAVADTNSDGDTLANCIDNCPSVTNQNQADWNTDGQGDVCDDTDGDSVLDSADNCRSVSNNTQTDTDGDLQGDACDNDDDNDGTADTSDGCPLNAPKTAAGQCGCATPDTNSDGDTIANCVDNCPNATNQNQADWNTDGQGDACDDSDGDGVFDFPDNCRSGYNPDQLNTDGDATGNVCDTDDDGDGDLDTVDNCKLTANSDQLDSDGDKKGNVCDNCPNASNWHQTDTDGDGQGNACDTDDDGDGTADGTDQCSTDPAKTTPGSCGCGFAEGCGAAHPLTGRYVVRSAIFNRARRGNTVDQVKAVGLSVVNITRDGTLSDVSCFAYTAPISQGAWWSWQRPSSAQGIAPVLTTLTAEGSNFRREPARNQLGYRMSLCTSTCSCEQATPSILIPPFVKPNPPNHCSLVDDDADGFLGITALGQQAAFANPYSNPSGLFSATLQVASSTASHWTITPNANGAGWHQGTAGDDGSYQNVVGCNSAGCGQLEDVVNTTCPETWAGGSNKVWFRPIAGNPTHDVETNLTECPNLVNQWNTPGYFMPNMVAPNDGTICPAP